MGKRNEYPEHAKLHTIKNESQAIGSFLDWMQNERRPSLQLCYGTDDEFHPFEPAMIPITKLLAEYFEIDLVRLEKEKQAMLDECRQHHESKGR